MLLDSFALLDEVVLSRGETALDRRSQDRTAELSSQARGRTKDLALRKHFEARCRRRLSGEGLLRDDN
jgi:hypothetical protein